MYGNESKGLYPYPNKTRTALVTLPELVKGAGKLFTLPDICLQLQTLIDSSSGNADQIGQLIASDPALTARILRIANSAFYSFPGSIGSVTLAITLLGTREVNNLAIATSAAQIFRTSGGDMVDMADFRIKSILTGLVNQALGDRSEKRHQAAGFVPGLLHDIGRLLVFEQIPELAASAVQTIEGQPFWERERDVLGYTFAAAGGHLLREWRLPKLITETVSYQHESHLAPSFSVQAAILCISAYVSGRALKAVTTKSDDQNIIDTDCYDRAGVSVEDSNEVVQSMLIKAAGVASLFFG